MKQAVRLPIGSKIKGGEKYARPTNARAQRQSIFT